ncbi:hypothetical protein Patl1_24421 [Pistacia atlantica]|uniref:Uncharacterized protein n=1 Tax=Pistacia atlantica TaxID=434234 RepID=A0ACC1A129_9ROSI|nr:hypothetical protein Patl1_24421 [Pistacia atlantica]
MSSFPSMETQNRINIARILVQTLILKHSSLIILATLRLKELVLLLQTAQLVGPIPKAGAFRLLVLMPYQSVVSPSPGAIAAFLKHPRTPTGMNGMDCQSEYSKHLMKRICTGQSDDVSFAGVAHTPNVYSQASLTKAVWGQMLVTQMKALCVPDYIAPSTDDDMWTANSHGNATSVVKLGHNTPSLHGLGYTNSGLALLALAASAVHKLWKWQCSERNPSRKLKRSAACIALSKYDSYVMSASGGKVSLFNMMTFKVKTKLKGHENQIAGLTFSQTLNALVSSGVDAQCVAYRSELIVGRFIDGPAYISNTPTYPFVIAAHPSEPNQIALGMSDRAVHVVEPLDVELKWGGTPSQDNGSPPILIVKSFLDWQPFKEGHRAMSVQITLILKIHNSECTSLHFI